MLLPKRLGYINLSLNETHGIPFNKVYINRELKHVSIQGEVVIKTCANGTLKYTMYQDIEQKAEEHMDNWLTKKLVASTVSSRRTRPRNQIESKTMSSLDYAALNAEEEGDRRSGQGGGRRALGFAHGDVPLCIQRSRNKDTIQQHDPSRNIDAHDEDSSIPSQARPRQKGKDSSKATKKKQKWKILRRRQQRSEKTRAAAQTQATAA